MKLYQICCWDNDISRFYPMPAFPLLRTEDEAKAVIEKLKQNPRNAKHKFIYMDYKVYDGETNDETNHA